MHMHGQSYVQLHVLCDQWIKINVTIDNHFKFLTYATFWLHCAPLIDSPTGAN